VRVGWNTHAVRAATAATCAALACFAAVPALAASPSLRVLATAPVGVRGAGFVPGERVVVTLRFRGVRTKTVVAGMRGDFVAYFRPVKARACEAFIVRAVGDRGSRAVFVPGQEECGTHLQP
jgi:hypothetical protein